MVEYHDILWDIATAKVSNLNINDVMYRYRPPIDSFFEWRDLRVMDEIQWYGWFIDYWMEGGESYRFFNMILSEWHKTNMDKSESYCHFCFL